MAENLTTGIVRILTADDTTAGAGFVVTDDGLIATCAHVVGGAGAGPGNTVRVVFRATGGMREARVEPDWWRSPDAEDVAILRLRGTLPRHVQALPLDRPDHSKGHLFETFGLPPITEGGMWGSGQILGTFTTQGVPMVQLRSQEITVGFSGAPVWDRVIQKVIGMVTAITPPDQHGRQAETVFAVSTELLLQVCPELEYGLRAGPVIVIPELQAGEPLDLQGKCYLVREMIGQKSFGTLVVRTARASDLSVSRDVGLQQVEALTDAPEDRAALRRIANHARTVSRAASQCGHLPQIHDVVDQEARFVWVVVEWMRGVLLDRLLPQDGPLPDAPTLLQLLHWTADVCEALSVLHRQRVSHGGVSSQTLLVTQGPRGTVLINPGFVAPLGPLAAEPPLFKPADDVRDLAATVYRVMTHRPPQTTAASAFNPFMPPELDDLLHTTLSGSIHRADRFKRRLHRVKQALRTR